ncbi:MAG: hypothetical protein DMF77_15115 [Acidobacteria bacterium]|nr:MAG: hypothetical protein DMF77_15115 [Acidobacteriota bacterium]
MPRIKVFGGTPQHSAPSLCLTCRRATVVKGHSLSSEIIRCHALDRTMDFPVRECDSYDDRSQPSLWDLKEIAWALVTDKRNRIGFVPRKDWSEALKREVDDLDDQE